MLWPQVLLVLLWAVRPFHCSGGGLFDETLLAETIDEAVKLGHQAEHHQNHHHPHHWPGKNHPHHHNKHGDHRKGETVCSCNHNSCVTSNYMCKTRLKEGCFFMKNKTVTSYGCVDQLSEFERLTCKIQLTLPKTKGHVELMCCQQDMCNYEIIKSSIDADFQENVGESPTYYDEFWVKVALIAVPLCGGIILVALVVLACKILQRDSKYEAHLRSSSSGYMQCHGADAGANANRHSKARLLLLEDGSPTSEKHTKNSIYKGPQDHKVITWVIASQGEKPSPV